MSTAIDDLTPQDLVVLDLVRNKGVGNFAVVTDLHPRDPALGDIRREAESRAPGYVMTADYGIYSGKRGTKLALMPDSITLQDKFYDGFESGHDLRLGG